MSVYRLLLAIIVIAYTVLASIYSVTSPLFEVSDELWHYPMVKYIADNGSLPVQNPQNPGPWRQEGSQPPLYYMLGAALTFWIDTSDMDQVRRVNPHADIGVVRPDGNVNMIVHRPELEAFPWQGTALAVHLVRFMSVLMGTGTVIVTYALARQVFDDWPEVALVAAALVAFLPMFLFIHGSVNNDALSNLLGNSITLVLVWLLKRDNAPGLRDYVLVGVLMGCGLLAKGNIAFLILVVAAVLALLSVRYRDWKPFVMGGLVSGGLTNLIAAWWYIRNWQLYGDPTGLTTFLDTVGRRLVPANAAQLWAERHSFLQAYWGFFGGVNVPLADWVYITFNTIGGLALLSALVYIAYLIVTRRQSWRWWLAAAVPLVWVVITFVSYLRWTAITPASQGRLVFGALSSLSLWMAVGLCWPLRSQGRYFIASGAVGFFAAVAVMTPHVLIAPTYEPPPLPEYIGRLLTVFRSDEDGQIGRVAMIDVGVQRAPARPGEYVLLNVDWQVIEEFNLDWSMYVHLVSPDGVIVAQRDVYPGRGLFATTDLPLRQAWHNPVAIYVPDTAYAPMTLDVMMGWYYLETGKRMEHREDGDSPVRTRDDRRRVRIGQVQLLPNASDLDVPNPVSVNFANLIELVGYEYSTLTPQQGEEMQVTLYWRALRPVDEDYVVFAHIIDAATFTIVGGSDAQPVEWTRPTSGWAVGDIIKDTHTFTVSDEANPMPYEFEVGLYTADDDGGFSRLRVVTPDGGMANNFKYLSRVLVLPDE